MNYLVNLVRRLFYLSTLSFIFLSWSNGYADLCSTIIAEPIDHSSWTTLLHKYVDEAGMVNYVDFQQDSVALNEYLQLLSNNPPENDWAEADQIAYWINAYNAFTVKIIAENYPLKSIRELHTLPGIATVWHKEFFTIGDQLSSLNEIEHKILRKKFEEPRIHFAINCASLSCPVLRNEAFIAEKLDAQLTDQSQRFLTQPILNEITTNKVSLSKIFKWFNADFTKKGTLIEFLNLYAPVKILPDAKVSYKSYNWSLNEQVK